MKINYFHDEAYPSTETDTQQVMKNLEALALAGADVSLFIPRFARSWGQDSAQWKQSIRDYYGIQKSFAIRGVACPLPGRTRWRWEKLSHGFWGPLWSRRQGPALLYTRNLPALLGGMASGQACVYETYKPLPRSAPGLFALLRPLVHRRRFGGIVTHSQFARQAFLDAGVPPEKVAAVHNGFDPRGLLPRLSRSQARAQLGLPFRKHVVGYAGNMQPSKDLPYLIQIISHLPEVTLLLVGGAEAHRQELECLAQKQAPGQVLFAGWVRGDRLGPYLYACDVLAIPPSSTGLMKQGDAVLPMKLFQYLGAGRPIFLPALPDTQELIIHQVHGWRTPANQLQQNVRDLQWLLTHPRQAAQMAQNCQDTAAQLTWAHRAQKLLAFFEARLAQ